MIYLIGFMGSGKTTAAQIAGDLLAMSVTDMDQCIEEQYGSIKTIFKQKGESEFRACEAEVLKSLKARRTLVSTGGGVVELNENISHMHYNGTVLYLQASFDSIEKRLKNDIERPLWGDDHHAQQALYLKRLPLYAQAANYTIKTDGRTPEKVGEMIAELVRLKA